MTDRSEHLRRLDKIMRQAADSGCAFQTAEDRRLDGREVRLGGRDVVNFASCSYLGLELDPRLKRGAIRAVEQFGTQFSSSRAYLSAPPYAQLEEKLAAIFGTPVIATPTTTLAHLSALPLLVGERDAMVLDHQVHHSVQMACQQAHVSGSSLEVIPHNRMDILEERIAHLCDRHRYVWYLCDSIYSMFGDTAPLKELGLLLERYEQLHLYVDDAHGMSWAGESGSGYALSQLALHPHMVLATSLNKSFAAGGGALVFPDLKTADYVRRCAGPLTFAGPIQPAQLGAGLASADIHLSYEIKTLQKDLQERIRACTEFIRARGLPLVSPADSPIQFVAIGYPRVVTRMVQALMAEGFFTNLAHFPAVPIRHAGVRFTLTRHHQPADIEALAEALHRNFYRVFEVEDADPEIVTRSFALPLPPAHAEGGGQLPHSWSGARRPRAASRESFRGLRLERARHIDRIPREEWDDCFEKALGLDWEAMRSLEQIFHRERGPGNDWEFFYYRIFDDSDRLVLSTFFTCTLWKADLLSPAKVSERVEEHRKDDPLFLTDRVFAMGCLLTEGNHLYLDRERLGDRWPAALRRLLEAVAADAEAMQARQIVLRDLDASERELARFFDREGFVELPAPESFEATLDWKNWDDFVAGRPSKKARNFQRVEVARWQDAYEVEVLDHRSRRLSSATYDQLHALYREVKNRNLALNTFTLPQDVFERLHRQPGWELLIFRAREDGVVQPRPVGVVAAYRGPTHYVPLVAGSDYVLTRRRGLYRQCLRSLLLRAKELGYGHVRLGIGAALEKRRFGGRSRARCIYVQADDHYSADTLALLSDLR